MVHADSTVLQLPIVLAPIVLWLVWQCRLAVAAPVALGRSPGCMWVLVHPDRVVWFPKQNMTDLFRAYDMAPRQPGTAAQAPPIVLSVLWGCYCLLSLLLVLALSAAVRAELGTASLRLNSC